MYICYIDESGVPDPKGGTDHFVLLGLAVPVADWRRYDRALMSAKAKHSMANLEIHTGWMARYYPEQERIPDYSGMTRTRRRQAVHRERKADLAKAALGGQKSVKSLSRNYKKTEPYTGFTHSERMAALRAFADTIGSWSNCVMFAEIQDKRATRPTKSQPDVSEKIGDVAFEQVVTRFHTFLARQPDQPHGLIVYDQNQALSTRLTRRMRRFYAGGTRFSKISQIVETPMFVDSTLTSMIQAADLCAFAVRKFIESDQVELFDPIYSRFDRVDELLVGARHYTGRKRCSCRICIDHGRRR